MEDDFLDACDIDFDEYAVEDKDLDLVVLFPEGKDEKLEHEYKELFSK